jgi:ubiquinone/menaquinone biosynthesis C-methylase UbiE
MDDIGVHDLLTAPAHCAVVAAARSHMPRPRCVVDLGCGTGELLERVSVWFPWALLVGVDASPANLAIAARKPWCEPRRPVWLRARAERLPFADARVDVLTAVLTCRHWRDLPVGLSEVARVLTGCSRMGSAWDGRGTEKIASRDRSDRFPAEGVYRFDFQCHPIETAWLLIR